MSKRFTDTDKWKKRWFRRLSNDNKVFWMYLLDQCDHAGIWEVDFELAAYFCNGINENEIRISFEKQFEEFDNGRRWFLKDFIEFQYGELKEKCKPHQSVIQRLNKLHIKGYPKGIQTLKDKDKDKDKVKDKDKGKKDQLEKIDLNALSTKFPNVEVKVEFEKWQDWMLANGKTFKNYNSSFKNWLRNDWVAKKADSDVAQKRKLICPVHEKQITFAERDTIKYCPECRTIMQTESHLVMDSITA